MISSLVFVLCGGSAAFMAHRGFMIFHDASRPYVHDMMEGQMERREWLAAAWPLSFGLMLGLGLPFALATGIILVHLLFLGTDLIGAAIPGGRSGTDANRRRIAYSYSLLAGASGMLFAAVLYFGVHAAVGGMERWPVSLSTAMQPIAMPVVMLVSLFPILVILRQFGAVLAGIGFVMIAAVFWTMQVLLEQSWLTASGASLLAGMMLLIIIVIRRAERNAESVVPIFIERTNRLKQGYFGIFAVGAFYAASVSGQLLAEGPQSLLAMEKESAFSATVIALARAVSFMPLKSMTALTSGTFPTDGFGFVPAVGLMSQTIIPAAFIGGAVMLLEARLIVRLARLADLFPLLRDVASHARTAMSQLLEIGLLIGCFISAVTIAGEWAGLLLIGIYFLNEYTGNRLPKMSVALIGLLVIYVLANMFAWLLA